MRLRLIALLAAIVVTPAIAQMQIQRPLIVPQIQPVQNDPDAAKKVMTIEEAQAQIAKLRAEKRELNDRLTETLATLDQWTKKGGSLVHAYCESDSISRNTSGASENCALSGYTCAPVEGTCRRSCVSSSDCDGQFRCENSQCVSANKYADHG
jgi:hypothetical protein